MTGFELTGVTKRYGETTALEEVSLSVREGEFFTLVGPSGCGKTTTLRLVAGFETPTTGEVTFDGRDVSGVPPEQRNVGVVFQNYALFPNMSVGENVAYGLRFSDPPDGVSRDERVRELLELVDLTGFESRDTTELSGGQQQRVALARALAPGPRILLLDEPMSALDAALRERLRAQVREIQQELGVTTLYVTHDQEEALAISDRVAVMNGGRVEQVDTPRGIYRRPETSFVASFIGDNNLVAGRVVDAASETLLVEVGDEQVRISGERPVAPGSTVTFAVRPERLHVEERGDEEAPGAGVQGGERTEQAAENVLTAHVERAEFLGESTRLWLDWKGRELVVRAPDPLEGVVRVAFDPSDAYLVETTDDQRERPASGDDADGE